MSCQRPLSRQDKLSEIHCSVLIQAVLKTIILSMRLRTVRLTKLISFGHIAILKSNIQQTETVPTQRSINTTIQIPSLFSFRKFPGRLRQSIINRTSTEKALPIQDQAIQAYARGGRHGLSQREYH